MMTRILIPLLCLTALASTAGALKVQVWDRDLQTKVGDGESSGSKLTMQFVGDYDGPVVVLFAQTDEEKTRVTFPGLKSSYSGTLSKGQLTLQMPAASGERAVNTPLTLSKFLTPFKLTLSAQPAGQSLSLPGLKTVDSSAKDSK
ncbi:hypothetical protein [Deinococcus arenicola]|uniref:Uncharacterized protein n=1 Tax=Deinococcus arenicola TaxID=2994950 RepID=A0ABU4DLA5_9DEIO|nr:hypothetical protein [Deinococcus sp. ZS9-10]MDV6373210.1 hypothetical protein [Deinococcus sp. ZS9-10]